MTTGQLAYIASITDDRMSNIPQLDLLNRLLDACAVRHRAIAQNVANVNTPGYQRLVVRFEEELARQLKSGTAAVHARPIITTDPQSPARADGNNVDLSQELSLLTKNSLLYHTYVQILALRIGEMRSAIAGR